jgi:hypothetical protein
MRGNPTRLLIRSSPIRQEEQWFPCPFFPGKKPGKHWKANTVRVQLKHHASRRRTRISDRTVHICPRPYKTYPELTHPNSPSSPRFLPFVAEPSGQAVAAAPTPNHPAGPLPDLVDRYVALEPLSVILSGECLVLIYEFILGILGFDPWRRRGSWRSWRTCRRTRPRHAAQVICSLWRWIAPRSCRIMLRWTRCLVVFISEVWLIDAIASLEPAI